MWPSAARSLLFPSLLLIGVSSVAVAQPVRGVERARFGYETALLNDGGGWGTLSSATLMLPRLAGQRPFVRLGGYRYDKRAPENMIEGGEQWASVRLRLAELGLAARLARWQTGGLAHRLSADLALSHRRRSEERPNALLLPDYTSADPDLEEMVEGYERAGDAFRAYRYLYNDGPGGEQDGEYVLMSYREQAVDLGVALTVSYTLQQGPFRLGVTAGFRGYDQGSPTTSAGVLAGLLF